MDWEAAKQANITYNATLGAMLDRIAATPVSETPCPACGQKSQCKPGCGWFPGRSSPPKA